MGTVKKWPNIAATCSFSQQHGTSLLSIVIAISLATIFMSIASGEFVRWKKRQSHLDLKAQKIALRRYLLESAECKPLTSCTVGTFVTIKNKQNTTIVEGGTTPLWTKFKDWSVRASCIEQQNTSGSIIDRMKVEVARPKPLGGFFNDPWDETPLSWSTLLEPGELCGQLAPPPPTFPVITQGSKCVWSQLSPTDQSDKICLFPAIAPQPYGYPLGKRMCCDDGRNATRPSCPNNKREQAAYWDRTDDWGRNGRWVVICR